MSTGGILEFTRVFMQRLSKPVSDTICNYTRTHPKMRSICIKIGSTVNNYYVRFTYYDSLHFRSTNTKLKIKPLSKKKAAELGAEIIAESLLTMIPITFLIIALKHKYKEDLKIQIMEQNIKCLTEQYDNLYQIFQKMEIELSNLTDQMMQISKSNDNMDFVSEQLGNIDIVTATDPIILQKQLEMLRSSAIENDLYTVNALYAPQ
eukprot:185526_1